MVPSAHNLPVFKPVMLTAKWKPSRTSAVSGNGDVLCSSRAVLLPASLRNLNISRSFTARDKCYWRRHDGGSLVVHGVAGGVTTAVAPGTLPLFALSTLYAVPLFLLMMLAPSWKVTRRLMADLKVFVPLAVAYAYLLIMSWQPDTLQLMMPGNLKEGLEGFNPQFFPKLEGIAKMFGRPETAASLWVHILAINLFFARHTYLSGLSAGIPTGHTILVAVILGPVALLCAGLTKIVIQRWNLLCGVRRDGTVEVESEDGKLIISPYTETDEC